MSTNRTDDIIGQIIQGVPTNLESQNSIPLNQGIETPPRDGEGNYLTNNNGSYVPAPNKPQLTPEALSQITNNGLDTTPIYETDDPTALLNNPENNIGTAFTSNIVGVRTVDKSGNVTDYPALNSAIEKTSKIDKQQLWNYKIDFFNHEQMLYQLRPHAIKSLVVEDDFLSWPFRGYIIVDNRMEGFERSTKADGFYHIRSDARDEIHIEIWPSVDPSFGTLPDEIWKISILCVVYDVEDMPSENSYTKLKKLYFWDKRFQMLQEKVSVWSTATGQRRGWFKDPILPPKPIAHLNDIERSMYTGDAVASLLIEAGYEDIIDVEFWDPGSSKINFVAKADWNYWDNIQYLLDLQTSEKKHDICQLTWNRAKQKLQLIPMHNFYEKAGSGAPGELQIEHLFFEAKSWNGINEASTSSTWKAPYSYDVSYTNDIKSSNFNTIISYRFSQTSGLDNSKTFVTKPVYSHWHKKKQFQVDVKEHEITQVKQFISDNYVAPILWRTKYPVMTLNLTKKEQLSIQPLYDSNVLMDPKNDRLLRRNIGIGSTLYAGIFLNQCLTVRLQGSTHRLSGTFIGVDRSSETSDTNYDYQLCGQYFVVNVKHIIQQDKYINELTLVKIHAYDKLKNFEGVY